MHTAALAAESCPTAPPCPLPPYVPLPQVALTLPPPTLAVMSGVLATIAERAPILDVLAGGRHPFITPTSTADLRMQIARRCGLADRVVSRELSTLVDRGLVSITRLSGRRVRLELLPRAYGWPDDDVERRRLARAGRLQRRYVPLPVSLLGAYTPAELAVAAHVLAAGGVGLYERAGACETIAVALVERELAASVGVTIRTVRRALDHLEADGRVVRSALGRGGIAIEIRRPLLGLEATSSTADEMGTFPTATPENADISDVALACARSDSPEREESGREGAAGGRSIRHEVFALYGALVAVIAVAGVTTSSIRARARRLALALSLAGVPRDLVAAVAITLARDGGGTPTPERIADRALGELRRRRDREAAGRRFVSAELPAVECELCGGEGHLFADSEAIGCPHDAEQVREWAVRRGWHQVAGPAGQTVVELCDPHGAEMTADEITLVSDEGPCVDVSQPTFDKNSDLGCDESQEERRRMIREGIAALKARRIA